MNDINRVSLTGRLGSDPELKTIQGTQITLVEINLCFTTSRKVNGKYEDFSNWMPLVFMNHNAKNVADYCRKGDKLIIDGRLTVQQWEKDGVKNSKAKIIVENFHYHSKLEKTEKTENYQQVTEDDIPF